MLQCLKVDTDTYDTLCLKIAHGWDSHQCVCGVKVEYER